MNKKLLFNILVNLILGIVFVLLNEWALEREFEETFIALALLYALVTIIVNGAFVWSKK